MKCHYCNGLCVDSVCDSCEAACIEIVGWDCWKDTSPVEKKRLRKLSVWSKRGEIGLKDPRDIPQHKAFRRPRLQLPTDQDA